jgi:uncharacterized membrane protein
MSRKSRRRKSKSNSAPPNSSGEKIPLEAEPLRPAWGHHLMILRNRVLSGLFLALPILITFFIIQWLYDLLAQRLILPIASQVALWWETSQPNAQGAVPQWVTDFLAPLIAILIILSTLFLLGMFFKSRVHRLIDWFFLQVPFVSTIYKSVKQVIDALQQSNTGMKRFQRVVLVSFPHPGCKVPGFVTSSCTDQTTGEVILCVYVPTTPIPTSGYMLLIPESDVMDLDWDFQETLQAIVSGGITVPSHVDYFPAATASTMQKKSDEPEAPHQP